ncbi:MAG: hypothetical protein R3C68_19675 [Myxococcota bacterium]
MTDYEYLKDGLLIQGAMRDDLLPHAHRLALTWIEQSIDPACIEILAETLARTAAELGEVQIAGSTLMESIHWIGLSPELEEFMRAATHEPLDSTGLIALGVHLVDIAERSALRVFVPELTALTAKSDRSGEAARRVGAARHLRG